MARTLPCSGCMTCLDPFQTLEEHYWDSAAHPKCKPCAVGFENMGAWTEVSRPFLSNVYLSIVYVSTWVSLLTDGSMVASGFSAQDLVSC